MTPEGEKGDRHLLCEAPEGPFRQKVPVTFFTRCLICCGGFEKLSRMKLVAYPLAAVLGFLGVMYVAGALGQPMQIVVGVVLLIAAGALVWLALYKPRPAKTEIVQKIDLSGDVALETLTCQACGGSLGKESVAVKAGAVFVHCPYCGTAYQIEEEPKW